MNPAQHPRRAPSTTQITAFQCRNLYCLFLTLGRQFFL